jgi:23S rRNA (uracil1939-C5)-methyltransferase
MKKIKIYSIGFGGEGIGKIDGKIAFIKNALPEEEVEFKILKETKSYIKGETVNIIKSSKNRINPICKYYGKCGGCQYLHTTYETELYYKKIQVNDILERIGKLHNVKIDSICASEHRYNYRNSVTLHKSKTGYGFYSTDNKTIIKIDYCHLLSDNINNDLKNISETKKKDIKIKTNYKGELYTNFGNKSHYYNDKILGKILTFSAKSFSQTNIPVAEKILIALNELITVENETTLFDAYSGNGFFTYLINGEFKNRIGIEEDAISIKCAKFNRKIFNYNNIIFKNSQTEKILFDLYNQYKSRKNILILDPPRTGLNKIVSQKLSEKKHFDEIYYLSCYPSTLARDINIIAANNYLVDKIFCFDMFPGTMHIETLVKLI